MRSKLVLDQSRKRIDEAMVNDWFDNERPPSKIIGVLTLYSQKPAVVVSDFVPSSKVNVSFI